MGNVGRNDPCPCGSGKKYKKCCGLKSSLQRRQFSNLNPEQVPSSMGKIAGMVSQTLKSINPEAAGKLDAMIKKQTDKLAEKMSDDPSKSKEEAAAEVVEEIKKEDAAKKQQDKPTS